MYQIYLYCFDHQKYVPCFMFDKKKVKGVVFNNKVFMNFKFCYSGINKMEIIRRFFKIQKLS